MDGLDFQLDIEQRLRGGDAVTELERLEAAFEDAQSRYADFEKESLRAAKALEKVGADAEIARTKMQAAMNAGDDAKVTKLAASLQELAQKEARLTKEAAAADAAMRKEAEAISGMADQIGEMKEAEKGGSEQVEGAAKGFKKLGGPLGQVGNLVEDVTEGFGFLEESLGAMGAIAAIGVAALAALAVGLLAVGAAALGGIAALAKFGAETSNIRREQELTLEAIAGTDAEGRILSETFDDISRSTAVGSERLLDITRDLKKAGLEGDDLSTALRAIAEQESALGDTSGTSDLVKALKDGTKTAGDLADEMDQKYGGVVSKKILGLDQQFAQFKRNIASIFGGLDLEEFLEGLSKLVALFDTSTASGQALKTIFESLFQPLFSSSGDVFTFIERGFLQLEIVALKFGIMVKEALKDGTSGLDLKPLKELYDLTKDPAWTMFGIALDTIGIGLRGMALFGLMVVGFIVDTINLSSRMLQFFKDLGAGVVETQKAFMTLGSDIVQGLIEGITGGAPKVIQSITSMASAAVDAAKAVLKSHSPSEVFYDIGESAPAGMAGGIDDGAPDVAAAVTDLVSIPAVKSEGKGETASAPIGPFIFQINGAQDSKSVANDIELVLTEFFERRARQVAT